MSGGSEGETLEYTPTWVVAALCTVIVALSLAVERLLHYCGIFLRRKNQKPLYEALQKVKEELMLLGFISLLLTVSQNIIAKTCVPENVVNDLLPCRLSEKQKEKGHESYSTTTTKHFQSFFPGTISGTFRRLLDEAPEANHGYCARKGKVPLLSLEAIHHLHIFIFVLAIVHVTFCVLTILFGGARIRQWKHWENEIAKDRYDTEQALLVWLHSFFKQFYTCVTKSDYITLRLGFIMTHTKGNPKFNFHRYMVRSLEDDFKTVVGISWYLWVFVVIFLLLNISGWHTYFWIAFIPLILLLAVGTKLEHVITQLAYEVQYGFDSCIMGQIKYIVPRLIIGVFIQVLCSYSTLPLYALVSQMGSTFKKSIFEEHVQVGLVGWAQKVKKKRGQKGSTEGSSEASSHASAGGLQLERLKRLKEANEGSTQSSSHEGSTLGNNASAPPFQLERLKGLKEANEGSAQSSSHEGSTLGNNASAPPFPREAEP
uniref:MLO-like protein n=1 Tax=Populus alba TaxID=43335 RepID=A0A4U5MY78_POPAL|nr:MLO-like protein 1 isoform X1 [Populus alba]